MKGKLFKLACSAVCVRELQILAQKSLAALCIDRSEDTCESTMQIKHLCRQTANTDAAWSWSGVEWLIAHGGAR